MSELGAMKMNEVGLIKLLRIINESGRTVCWSKEHWIGRNTDYYVTIFKKDKSIIDESFESSSIGTIIDNIKNYMDKMGIENEGN